MKLTLTPAQFHAALSKLYSEPGASVSLGSGGNSGSVTGDGVTIGFTYDGSSSLAVNVLSKPWYLPESVVESHISQYFAAQ
jgi:hypothetical protein